MIALLQYLFSNILWLFWVLIACIIVGVVLCTIGMALLFKKANEKWWKALVPFYSFYLLYKIADTEKLYFPILCVFVFTAILDFWIGSLIVQINDPLVTVLMSFACCGAIGVLVLHYRACISISSSFNKGPIFCFLLVIGFPVTIFVLGLTNSEYYSKFTLFKKFALISLSGSHSEILEYKERFTKFAKTAIRGNNEHIEKTLLEDGKAHFSVDYDPRYSLEEHIEEIEEECYFYRPSVPVVVTVKGELSEEMKAKFKFALKRKHLINFKKLTDKLHRNKIVIGWMFILGIMFLVANILVTTLAPNILVLPEIFTIAAWVFVWTGVQYIAFNNPELRDEILKIVQYGTVEIKFEDKGENHGNRQN